MSDAGDDIRVEVQLFARLREVCGDRANLEAAVPSGASTEQCFAHLCRRFEALAPFRETLAVAVNDEYVTWEHELQDGDVVAFIPPVSGGAAAAPAARPTGRGDLQIEPSR